MIYDSLKHASQYAQYSAAFAKAFAYLEECMKKTPEPGKYELDGAGLYASVQAYAAKPESDVRWEAHRRYIDIQCVLSGREKIGRADAADMINPGEYDTDGDVRLSDDARGASYVTLTAGLFAILYPWDAHRPCLRDGEPSDVIKVVVKVAAD